MRTTLLVWVVLAGCSPRPVQHAIGGERYAVGHQVGRAQMGHWVMLGPNGRPIAAGSFRDNLPDGIWKQYFPDGSLRQVGRMHNARLHGRAQTWHANGQLASEGEYDDGVPIGPWLYWREDGEVDDSRTGFYEAGRQRR